MKKLLTFCLLLVFALSLAGCGGQPEDSEPSAVTGRDEPDITVADIVDRTRTEPLVTADVLEGFWQDEEYTYYFGSLKSHYVIVHYSDGTQEPVGDALQAGRITLADLERFDIAFYREEKVN